MHWIDTAKNLLCRQTLASGQVFAADSERSIIQLANQAHVIATALTGAIYNGNICCVETLGFVL